MSTSELYLSITPLKLSGMYCFVGSCSTMELKALVRDPFRGCNHQGGS